MLSDDESDTPLQCTHCTDTFDSEIGLKTHVGRMHPEVQKVFMCEHCQHNYSSKQALVKHNDACKVRKGLKTALDETTNSTKKLNKKLKLANQDYHQQIETLQKQVQELQQQLAAKTQECLCYQVEVKAYKEICQIQQQHQPTSTSINITNMANHRHKTTDNRVTTNNTATITNNATNNNVYANLQPITDAMIKSCSNQLHAGRQQPILSDSVSGFTKIICNMGLKDNVALLDGARYKTAWINGDNNNEHVKDNGSAKLANKIVNASQEDMIHIARYAAAKITEASSRHDIDGAMYYANVLGSATSLQNDSLKTKPQIVEEMGRSISKIAIIPISASNAVPSLDQEEVLALAESIQE